MVIRDVEEIRLVRKTTQAHVVPIKQELMPPHSITIQYFWSQYLNIEKKRERIDFLHECLKTMSNGEMNGLSHWAIQFNSYTTQHEECRWKEISNVYFSCCSIPDSVEILYDHCTHDGYPSCMCFVLTFMSDSLIKTRKECFESHPLFHADPQSACSYAHRSILWHYVESFWSWMGGRIAQFGFKNVRQARVLQNHWSNSDFFFK